MKRTLSSLVQSKEEKDINVFTGEPDVDIDIVSTDGETVVSAQLSEQFQQSFQQCTHFQSVRKEYDKQAHLLEEVHRRHEQYSINNIQHALRILHENDKFLLNTHMHQLADGYRTDVFCFQSRMQDVGGLFQHQDVSTMKDKKILIIPVGMFVDTLNQISMLFDVASKKKSLAYESSYDKTTALIKRHCSVATSKSYGYTYTFVQQAKNAFYGLVACMEEAKDQQVPEEETFVVPTDDKQIDTEEVDKELQEDLEDTLRLQAYTHGTALLKRIGVLLYQLLITTTPDREVTRS